jgi:hypothetical protein
VVASVLSCNCLRFSVVSGVVVDKSWGILEVYDIILEVDMLNCNYWLLLLLLAFAMAMLSSLFILDPLCRRHGNGGRMRYQATIIMCLRRGNNQCGCFGQKGSCAWCPDGSFMKLC